MLYVSICPDLPGLRRAVVKGRGNKSGRATAMRVSKAKHSPGAGIYAVDFAACPEILPRPGKSTTAARFVRFTKIG